MQLSNRTIESLAKLICGDEEGLFKYRSSSKLTQFFHNCDLNYAHDGSTRYYWVENVLNEINKLPSNLSQLPNQKMIHIIQELLDINEYDGNKEIQLEAFRLLNSQISREGLEVLFDLNNEIIVRNVKTNIVSRPIKFINRSFTQDEIIKRTEIEKYLNVSSEDEIIINILVPLFRQLGFQRVVETGHKDRSLEFGKDLWMKFQLPTLHYIYFCAQVKKEKIDSSGKSINQNITTIINQANMALMTPIFDPESNRKILIDHIYIISANEITKQARQLIIEKLDQESRRHMIFMDKNDLLDLGTFYLDFRDPNKTNDITEIPF